MNNRFSRATHRGMALIVSLVLLLSMTLLALAALQNTNLEERMAGNLRAENISLQAAEAALRTGEAWLDNVAMIPVPVDKGNGKDDSPQVWKAGDVDTKVGPYSVTSLSPWWKNWDEDDWLGLADDISAVDRYNPIELAYVAKKGELIKDTVALADERVPRFLIEEDGFQPDHLVIGQQQDTASHPRRYRVTARGIDAGGRGEVLLQTQFVRRF